jgi:hypothetical protein
MSRSKPQQSAETKADWVAALAAVLTSPRRHHLHRNPVGISGGIQLKTSPRNSLKG